MRAFWSLKIFLLLCVFGLSLQGCGGGGGGGSDSPSAPIIINSAPVANAGTAQSVTTGAVVTLDGSGSSDANSDPLTYIWSFTSKPAGSTAALSNTTVVKPIFTADVAGAYALNLVVNDGKVSSAATAVTVTAVESNNGSGDTTPPQLQSLSIAPTTVDVSTQAQTINFTAHITDNLSGFTWGVITITSPSGKQQHAANGVLSSGNSLDGVWTFPITMPKSSETGAWKVTQILLEDNVGNMSNFTETRVIQVN